MLRKLAATVLVCTWLQIHAQTKPEPAQYDRHNVEQILGFEARGLGDLPAGWVRGSLTPPDAAVLESEVVQSGSWAMRLDRSAHATGTFSAIHSSIPIDFSGSRIELRGFLRTRDVQGLAGLWMREDGESGVVLQLDTMNRQGLNGTHDWQQFSVILPLDPAAKRLVFGAMLVGTGITWVDGLQLLVDGVPVTEAPERAPQQLETDRTFDQGSGIQLATLTPTQIENLVALGRLWGFLKYHHPAVTAGKRRWDYDLFRVIPGVLAAGDRPALNEVLVNWIDSLGSIEACKDCVSLDPAGLKLKPDLSWIDDTQLLGPSLSSRLQSIYRNRVRNQQYYVSLVPQAGNPLFDHESAYEPLRFPDSGYQLLALYRLWNIVEYWAPDRDVVGEDWPRELSEFIPRVMLAKDKYSYSRAMMALIADIHDTHANLWSSLSLRPPAGGCRLPIDVRFIDGRAVVTDNSSERAGSDSGLQRGDEITTIDGVAVNKLVADWSPFYAASNDPRRLNDRAVNLTNGSCGPVQLEVRRSGVTRAVASIRLDASAAGPPSMTHDQPGPTFRIISKDVAYLKLASAPAADMSNYIRRAYGTRGLIIDIRGYPSNFDVFALGSLLVRQPTPFVKLSGADLSNPGAFQMGNALNLAPAEPHYDGKVVVLVDETSLSRAEYTAVALQSAPHTLVIGSTTAGADGDLSGFPLPGGLRSAISGLGVFYPNGTPTQRVGVHVDIEVHPTIRGIRAGRDEVMEAGFHKVVPGLSLIEVEKLARPDRADSQSRK
jgi:C-terminal processing protease CtpA/Prc